MESKTKNKKDSDKIQEMLKRAFPAAVPLRIHELKEGYFNAAYEILLSDEREVILKIGPKPGALIMSYEKNIMFSEVMAMELAAEHTELPVAKILYYDDSKGVCESSYFVMEKLPGKSLNQLSKEVTAAERGRIYQKVGEYSRQIHTITGENFGYFGQEDLQGPLWFPVFLGMVELALKDACSMNIDLKIDTKELLNKLRSQEKAFSEVKVPRLVHWDLWDGNIFVERGEVTGIIDFERCLWGDPLMEVGFRSYEKNQAYLDGYGISDFSENQRLRIFWYDIYVFLLVALEYDYRGYETAEMYEWAVGMLKSSLN